MVKATWKGKVIAESSATVQEDGHHYFPADSVNWDFLKKSGTTSVCGVKGKACYYTINVNGEENPDAAWCYENPKDEVLQVKGRIGFWNGVDVS
mmetsp:Transcript_119489/g.178533  ORF Transcript_119489/g.178533 Transcript_119489/m.178533 type:complete len:94 (+) Transcript_119489:54-335(+)|eukprot:CAMPEP_0117046300 /NCGR_PEP_ID=MMETSP0472-20121206/32015_1 /TAXON_ID=693140 ORGANISM="Tiarina fusus, Strain LIS" /NCGR_SAMPLE_ID=MMETSP0472 /ASSEMBLY_ACC=CAM_ASM_000603 /LENGTH=93 /DNA_ID=CAMNT_0004758601 /DNA_START=43 /DNA_END=324 /DNA_ORIENTATION=+